MSVDDSTEDECLKKQVEETINYLSFSVKQDVETNGSIGFRMQSKSGRDMSFVITIETNEDGVIASGAFGDPSKADIMVTVPAEDFVNIYQGDTSLSTITSLVLRGKIAVRNYDLNGVSRFMNSFEFSSQKWKDYYAYQEELEKREKKIHHINKLLHNFRSDPIVVLHRPFLNNGLFEELYHERFPLPSIPNLLIPPVSTQAIPSILSSVSYPVEVLQDETISTGESQENLLPTDLPQEDATSIDSIPCDSADTSLRREIVPSSIRPFNVFPESLLPPLPTPAGLLREAINSFDRAYPDVTDTNEPNMFTEDSTVNMWEGLEMPKAIQRLESFLRRKNWMIHFPSK